MELAQAVSIVDKMDLGSMTDAEREAIIKLLHVGLAFVKLQEVLA